MADILKITSPVVDKNQQTQVHPGSSTEATAPFQMQDIAKVAQTTAQASILKQNTGLVKEGAPNLLENLLKDPAVAETYLKNISMLEEIYKLLPANNRPVTEEIETLFERMLVKPDEVAQEMQAQETYATAFRGAFFDLLRQICRDAQQGAEVQPAVAKLLRAINYTFGNRDIRDAVANSLEYLAERLSSSKNLAPQLAQLAGRFRAPDAEQNFQTLKEQTLALLQDVRGSILFSQEMEKVVSITVYNLSRHNSNKQFLQESAIDVWRLLDFRTRDQFKALFTAYQEAMGGADAPFDQAEESSSKVMDTLVRLLSGDGGEKISAAEQERMEKIIRSLLSSPSNFTPLLHFVIPMAYQDLRSFAEIWIDPQSQDRGEQPNDEKGIHFLMVIDVEAFGRFEAEVYERENQVDFTLYCPPQLVGAYRKFARTAAEIINATDSYYAGSVHVEPLQHPRSLMQVFQTLPYRRTGVDVKI